MRAWWAEFLIAKLHGRGAGAPHDPWNESEWIVAAVQNASRASADRGLRTKRCAVQVGPCRRASQRVALPDERADSAGTEEKEREEDPCDSDRASAK